MVADYIPGGTKTTKTGRERFNPNLLEFWNHKWFREYVDDFKDKNIFENNGIISGCVISDGGSNSIDVTSGEAFIGGKRITVAAPANYPTPDDGWHVVYVDSAGDVQYEHWVSGDIQSATTQNDAAIIGFALRGNAAFQIYPYYNEISDLPGITNVQHIQPDVTVGVDLVTDPRATNIETDFVAALSAGDKLLFLAGITLTAARVIAVQVEVMADGPDVLLALDTFDLTLDECSGYISLTTVSGDLILDGITHGLIINGAVAVVEGSNFLGSYCLNGVWNSPDANIQLLTQPDHVILTSAKQALYANDDKILRVDADGVTFRRKDNTSVVISDNTIVAIDSTEQLTNDLHFDFDNSDIEILRQFQIDTNSNKVFIDGDKCRVNVHTTEDFNNGLEAETEEDQRVIKNRGSGNIIGLNGRRIFSGGRPMPHDSPVLILDPYIISQNGDSFEGFKVSGSNDDVCLFTDWWKAWEGLDIVGDGTILIPPVFNPFSGVLQRKVFSDDPAGRFLRYNTPIGGSTGVDPDVHARTSPTTLATIASYTSSASAEISDISDADALKLKIGARVADAGSSIPQASSGTPKTTIISSIVHNSTDDNSIFLIDSETGSPVVVSATGNLTIDMSGNSGISHQLDAMQRITGTLGASPTMGLVQSGSFAGVFSDGDNKTDRPVNETASGNFVNFDNADSVSPNPAKTNDDQTFPISRQGEPYLIM